MLAVLTAIDRHYLLPRFFECRTRTLEELILLNIIKAGLDVLNSVASLNIATLQTVGEEM